MSGVKISARSIQAGKPIGKGPGLPCGRATRWEGQGLSTGLSCPCGDVNFVMEFVYEREAKARHGPRAA